MFPIILTTIPHANHRYPTAGDYQKVKDGWVVKVSDLGDWRLNLLLAVHELVELSLTQNDGIPEDLVTRWDKDYARSHPDDEPGECPHCPYHWQHQQAEAVEQFVSILLGVKWHDYKKALNSLWAQEEPRKKRKQRKRATGAKGG